MVAVAEFSLDDLRERSLEALKQSEAQANEHGVTRFETDSGLEIENAEGWLRITGTVVDFIDESIGADVDYEIMYAYTETWSPQVTRYIWKNSKPEVKTLPKHDHHKVATELIKLFFQQDQAEVAS